MKFAKAKLDSAGRILIPAEFRKALQMTSGEYLAIDLEDNELCVYTMPEATKRIQESTLSFVRGDSSLVDDLLRQRSDEASRE